MFIEGIVYGVIALLGAVAAIAIVGSSDNKRKTDPDVIAAKGAPTIVCPKCPNILEIKEDINAHLYSAAYVSCTCGFHHWAMENDYPTAVETLIEDIDEEREKTNLINGVANG